jgi:tripartite-type tricarboxylate transporter receptor subunit TctC
VQQAAPDGYTLLVFAGAQHAALAALQSVSYDPVNDFEPVTVLFNLVNFLAVPKDSSANSVAELLEIGRKKPGGLTFGSTGVGSPAHLQAAILSRSTKTPMEYVQYRGSAPLMSDLVTGRVDFSFVSYTGVRSFLSDGKLKILAVINDQRWSDMPNVPTLTEAGVTMDDVGTWFGVIAPKGTPSAVVQRLNAEFVTASKDPELRRKLLELGVVITTTSPAQMRTLMVDQVKRTRELVEALGLRSQ